MENPSTKRLREEFMSTNCRLESPTAVIMPKGRRRPLEALRGPGGRHCPCHSAETRGSRAALTEQGAEHAPQDGVRERSEEGREFADGAQNQHDTSPVLHYAPAADLPGSEGAGTRRVSSGGGWGLA